MNQPKPLPRKVVLQRMKHDVLAAIPDDGNITHTRLVRVVLGDDQCPTCHRLFHRALRDLEPEGCL